MFFQTIDNIIVETHGPSLIEITKNINNWIKKNKCFRGILNTYIMHTSASLLIQENADPKVLEDLLIFFSKSVPNSSKYLHQSEGSDDMPAHIKSSITNTSLSFSIQGGRLILGTWQGIYLFEHRDKPHSRKVNLHFMGE